MEQQPSAENIQPTSYNQDAALVAAPAPVSTAERIQAVDMVRGFALLGILLMNIIGFGINNGEFQGIIEGPHNKDYYALATILIFPDGTMRGLFSMLFGVGMVLFTLNKTESPNGPSVAEFYYRRLLYLVLFGVFNAFILLWEGDILFFYGLTGMLLYPFRKSSPKLLLALGLFCFFINAYKTMEWFGEVKEKRTEYVAAKAAEKEKKKLTEEQQGAIAAWQEIEKNGKPDTARNNEHQRKMEGSYATIFTYFIPDNANGEIWGMYHGIWDFLGMMLIGMGLFWLGFFNGKYNKSTYFMLWIVGYTIGLTVGYIVFKEAQSQTDRGYYLDHWRVPHWILYDVRRLFITVGHASLLMLLYKSGLVKWLMKALANVGQMAFTNYLMQSIICTLFFYGYGLGYYNKFRFHEVYYVVFSVWIFQIIFSAIWLRYFRFGPFEWLWRSLTYWKRQPMKL